MNIIIPLGGKGERFLKRGYQLPKPLIRVLNKEIIFYLFDNLVLKEDDTIFIIYNKDLDEFDFCKIMNERYPYINHFIRLEEQTLGAAETISIGLNYIMKKSEKKRCMLLDCDTFYTYDVLTKYREMSEKKNGIFYFHDTQPEPIFSYIQMNEETNQILRIVEKEKISDYANVGIYCFNDIYILKKYCDKIISENIRFRGEYYLSCVVSKMLEDRHYFEAIFIEKNNVHSLGTPEQVDDFCSQNL